MAMGSPSFLDSQLPPKPDHSEFPWAGPKMSLPVDLSNTAKDVLTHWTYCVRPTAPLVSGGMKEMLNPYCPAPSPSKLLPTSVAGGISVRCRSGSSVNGYKPAGS